MTPIPHLLLQVGSTALWLIVSGALTIAFLRIYVWITPYNEFQMIREGNAAAALSLSGALIGFVLPLVALITHTPKILDLVIWGGIALVLQLIVYFLVELFNKGLRKQMEQHNAAAGGFLGASSFAAGMLLAACLVP